MPVIEKGLSWAFILMSGDVFISQLLSCQWQCNRTSYWFSCNLGTLKGQMILPQGQGQGIGKLGIASILRLSFYWGTRIFIDEMVMRHKRCKGSTHWFTHCGLVTAYSSIGVVNIGSGNCLVTDVTKPWPEPMLTSRRWVSVAFTWKQFHIECQSYYFVQWAWDTFKVITAASPIAQQLLESTACSVYHYGNQSRGYFKYGRPLWPPAVPRLAARPSQSNPRGSGPEVVKRERGHVTSETWSLWGGGLQGPPA